MPRIAVVGSTAVRNYPLVALLLDTLTELQDVEVEAVGYTNARGVSEDAVRWANERGYTTVQAMTPDQVVKWAAQDPDGIVVVLRKDVWDQNETVATAHRRGLITYVYDVPEEQREKTVADLPASSDPVAPASPALPDTSDSAAFWDRVADDSRRSQVVNDAFSRWDAIDPSLDSFEQRDRLRPDSEIPEWRKRKW